MVQNKYAAQAKWEKEHSAKIVAKYKKEFVEEFKESCKELNLTQSEVIRAAMNEVIKKAKNEREKNMTTEEIIENLKNAGLAVDYDDEAIIVGHYVIDHVDNNPFNPNVHFAITNIDEEYPDPSYFNTIEDVISELKK